MDSKLFKVLADENRNTIIKLLIYKELCVCDLEAVMGMKQANVSKHMMKLRKEGIVEMRKEAQWVYYRLSEHFSSKHALLISYLKEQVSQDEVFQKLLNDCSTHNHCSL